jgi:superfamily II DNA or RNA helicase
MTQSRMHSYRYYQEEVDLAIKEELLINDKCLVKMFCGTGKSLVMRYCDVVQNQNLLVYVFPSLSLVEQFDSDYLFGVDNKMKICSDKDKISTTDTNKIIQFLKNEKNKIICITYQSFDVLIDCLKSLNKKINMCCFDEAHHIVADGFQELVFHNEHCEKQIFFTATPKNANGITMYDSNHPELSMCGKLVYDYSYLNGMKEGYLNPFEIRVDMYTENTNRSIYECIARGILTSGNTRVLTFHSDVSEESESDTSVLNFVKEDLFITAFKEIQQKEFPTGKKIKKIKMIALTAKISVKERKKILADFDKCSDNNVYIISSCETIGEGIDTKNANMCVFVDPKTSHIKIIQNIGRIVRKQFGIEKPSSTILIPCWIDRTKYIGCEGDKEKCDEIIRQDMNQQGNFNGILNVMSALKQEDEEIYNICLHYPDRFSPMEIENNLEQQGYTISDPIGDGELIESIEGLLGRDIDYDDDDDEEDMIRQIAEDNDICVEIHTDSLENPIEKYNDEDGDEDLQTIRLLRSEEDDEIKYYPIVSLKPSSTPIKPPNRQNRLNINVHTNPDIRVFWGITSELDLSKDICSCVIDCEVVKYDPMEVAKEIVGRAKEREKQKLNLLPRQIIIKNRTTPELIQENKDATKLSNWKNALKGKGNGHKCSDEVRDYLDTELPGWRTELDFDIKAMEDAKEIVERAKERKLKKLNLLPRQIIIKNRTTPELIQEHSDATKLGDWKQALKGKGTSKCPDEVRDYLDTELPRWRTERDTKAMEVAKEIVGRAKERTLQKLNLLPRQIIIKNRTTPELIQEDKDAKKLGNWKTTLKGKGKCSDEVRDYLDTELSDWRTELDSKAMEDAKEIVGRAKERKLKKLNLLPRNITKKENRTTPELKQEYRDATKLSNWKQALKGTGAAKCPDEVRDYLDTELPGWRKMDETSSSSSSSTKKKSMKLKITPSACKKENPEEKKARVKSELSQLHQEYKTLRSDNLNQKFKENPELWKTYHQISEENERSFPEEYIPRNVIIEKLNQIKTKRAKEVVDMGCGKAHISKYFKDDKRFHFTNFDHISSDESVISRDISNTGLEEDSVEICILSLAMWGSNRKEYIMEAYRILESNGTLYIIEPTKRWSEKDEQGNIIQGREASRLKQLIEENNFKIIEETIEKFCVFVCIK